MAEIDASGDTTYAWSQHDPEEVALARAHFDTMRRKGYAAYQHRPGDARGDIIRTFDPAAERIVFLKPLQGG